MKTYRFRSRINNPGYVLPSAANQKLDHLPGPDAPWLVGHLARFLSDDHAYIAEQTNRYGDLFTVPGLFGRRTVFMLGIEANEIVLGNASKTFSNHHAYRPLRAFAGSSVVTRDLKDHSELRKIVAQSFSRTAITGYLEEINSLCFKSLNSIPNPADQEIHIYPLVKSFALGVATKVFSGIDYDSSESRMSAALEAILELSNAKLPLLVPGTIYYRGTRGRAYVEHYFRKLIPVRRETQANDLFTHLCTAENDAGERLSDDDVIDNVIGAMIAGHDTSTIAIVALLVELAKSPERQNKLAEECQAIFDRSGERALPSSEINTLPDIDLCVKEILRLYTPIRYIQRRLTENFTFREHQIPANSNVIVGIYHSHLNGVYFEHPTRFFPERFGNDSNFKKIPPYAWTPFGKGAHLCIGMQFAMLEIKAFIYQLLLSYKIDIAPDYHFQLAGLPVSKPTDGVPLRLSKRDCELRIKG